MRSDDFGSGDNALTGPIPARNTRPTNEIREFSAYGSAHEIQWMGDGMTN
jgi:hypothetical protein